jgi:hypothetical protein
MKFLSSDGPTDIREVLGLHTRLARLLMGTVVIAMVYCALQNTAGIAPLWPVVVVIAIMAAATVAVIVASHDPLRGSTAALLALSTPAAAVILLCVVPVPLESSNQVWVSGYATIIYVFMCLRGRALYAWLSIALTAVIYGLWTSLTDQGWWAGASIPLYNSGAVAVATVLAIAIRPTIRSIFVLRQLATERGAHASAIAAAQQERTVRLRELDQLARPLLARIATGEPLSDVERQSCELLEAHLRDQLRAQALVNPTTAAAARAARGRGVEVLMIDDGGLDDAAAHVRDWASTVVADTLAEAGDGDVRIRVLPPGRSTVLSIYRSGMSGTRRIDLDRSGRMSNEVDVEGPANDGSSE